MGVMDKFLNYMRFNDGDNEEYYDDEYLDDEEDVPAPKKSSAKQNVQDEEYEDKQPIQKRSMQPKVTPIRQVSTKKLQGSGMEVCVIRPTNVDDAREITETLLSNRTVVLNLEGIDVDVAQRIIDFTSGSCFAINGNLQKISHYIFIITPASVDVSGDFQELLGGAFDSPLNSSL